MPGVSIVTVQFTSAANPDLVSSRRPARRQRRAQPSCRPTPTIPPITKVDINALGVATIVLSGPQSLSELQDVAENVVQPRVQRRARRGHHQHSLRRHARGPRHRGPGALARPRPVDQLSVINALQSQQLEVPAGTIAKGGRDFSVYFDSLAARVQSLGDLVVQSTPQGTVRLSDVATVTDTTRDRDGLVRVDGQEGIALVVVKLPDANMISVVDARQEEDRTHRAAACRPTRTWTW